jgi:hypothetical protein
VSVTINFDAPVDPDVNGVNFYESPSQLGTYIYKYTATITSSSTSATYPDGNPYFWYKISFKDASGNEGPLSDPVYGGGAIILKENQVITFILDSTIQATDGSTLGSEYEFYFTTVYNPIYASLRRVKLESGAYLQGLENDTIMFALFEASIEADFRTWSTTATSDFYKYSRSQWVLYRACEILLLNQIEKYGKKSKTLGDLSVTWNGEGAQKKLEDVIKKKDEWLPEVQHGGTAVAARTPAVVVKGEADVDRPPTGRMWIVPSQDPWGRGIPAANTRIRLSGYRIYRSSYLQREASGS